MKKNERNGGRREGGGVMYSVFYRLKTKQLEE